MNTQRIVAAVAGVLILSLAVSLAVNAGTRHEIASLREELQRVRNAQQIMQGMLNDINEVLWAMEERARWIIDRQWHLEECGEEVPAAITWTFRELPPVETVVVQIRPLGEEEWRSFPAHETDHLSYRSEVLLSGQVEWEYRIVAEGSDGARAGGPWTLDAFAELKAQEMILYQGETVDHEGSTWISFVVQNLARNLNDCTRIEDAELRVTLYDGTTLTLAMQKGRIDDLPPGVDPSVREEHLRLRLDASENWWSQWFELPEDRFMFLATVTLGDGTEVRLDDDTVYRRTR